MEWEWEGVLEEVAGVVEGADTGEEDTILVNPTGQYRTAGKGKYRE